MAAPFVNKLLNILGLEDDKQASQSSQNDYASGNYGGGSTYIPQSQRNANRTRSASRSIPAQGGKSNSGARKNYGEDEYADRASSARRSYTEDYSDRSASRRSDFDDDYGSESRRSTSYDWENRRSTGSASRPRSRFEEEPVRPAAPQPKPRTSVRPSRTVMRTLVELEDCCDIIDELIKNNTIVLTMDTNNEHTLQRATDTLAGAVFALNATMRKASETTYLLAPAGVEVNTTGTGRERY